MLSYDEEFWEKEFFFAVEILFLVGKDLLVDRLDCFKGVEKFEKRDKIKVVIFRVLYNVVV